MTGIPQRFKLLFQTAIHTMLSRPVRKRISWMTAISRERRSSQSRTIIDIKDTDQLLLNIIMNVQLVPSLRQFEDKPPLRMTSVTIQERTLFIE